jgi:hypothetical protein
MAIEPPPQPSLLWLAAPDNNHVSIHQKPWVVVFHDVNPTSWTKTATDDGSSMAGRVRHTRRGTGRAADGMPTLRTMSALLGVIVVAGFGLVVVLGIAAVAALFRVTRRPADSPRGSESGD